MSNNRYTCIGKGGEYELLGSAIGAGTLKDMSPIPVYRNIHTGQLFVRTPLDFATRMVQIEPLHPHNDGLDEYREPVHVGELDPARSEK